MSWNYRICRQRFDGFDPEIHDEQDEYAFGIHEVYYNSLGEIYAISADPVDPYGTSVEELAECFMMMNDAFVKDVINLDEVEYAENDVE